MEEWQRRLNEVESMKDRAARLAAYQELVAAVPRAGMVWSNLGVDLAAAGRLTEARRAVLRAFAEDPALRRNGPSAARDLALIGDCELVAELVATPAHVVYHAVRTSDQRPVLVRSLPGRDLLAATEVFGHHEVLTRVRSVPHVVKALGTAEAPEGTLFQILEHVRGQVVSSWLATIAGDPRRGATVVAETARALAAAQREGVTGFDLRPEFLVRADDRGAGVVSLGPLARTGATDWLAPEERDGSDGGERAQVFRLGLLMYLTSGASLPSADAKGGRAFSQPASWSATPSALEAVKRATAASPDNRPKLGELAELAAAIAGERAPAPEVGGRRVGGLRLVRVLGEGRTAVVWEAEDEDGTRRAVKILHKHCAADGETRLRFLNEAKLAGSVDHPGVVRIFGSGKTTDDEHYLVMELSPGGSLAERLMAGKLSVASSVTVGIDVAEAMAAVHAVRTDNLAIIHRDIKPSNLLVADRNADPPKVKVCDFGVAKLQGEPTEAGIPLTRQGSLLGTPPYMAPEQWMMVDDLDARADVYGLGVVLFECLTGERPYAGKNDYELQQAHLHAPVPSLTERGVPADLAAIVERMLRKDRRERYQTMAEVADALRKWRAKFDVPTVVRTTVRLTVTTSPAGAEVLVDGREAGVTPCTIDVTPAPKVEVIARRAGSVPHREVLAITSDTNVSWTLAPARGAGRVVAVGALGVAMIAGAAIAIPKLAPDPKPPVIDAAPVIVTTTDAAASTLTTAEASRYPAPKKLDYTVSDPEADPSVPHVYVTARCYDLVGATDLATIMLKPEDTDERWCPRSRCYTDCTEHALPARNPTPPTSNVAGLSWEIELAEGHNGELAPTTVVRTDPETVVITWDNVDNIRAPRTTHGSAAKHRVVFEYQGKRFAVSEEETGGRLKTTVRIYASQTGKIVFLKSTGTAPRDTGVRAWMGLN